MKLNKEQEKLAKKIEAEVESLSDLPMVPTDFGIRTVSKKAVDRDWEIKLSDILYAVTGVSHFFSGMAFRCEYLWTLDIPTAAAGAYRGKFYIFINPVFMFSFLTDIRWRTMVVIHEVFHIFYQHPERGEAGGYDHKTFNQAADFYIHSTFNQMIKHSERAKTNMALIPKDLFPLCFDTKYDNMTEEEIYAKLIEEQPPQSSQSDEGDEEGDGGVPGDGDGDPSDGEGNGSGEGEGKSGKGSGSGSGGDDGDQSLDVHLKPGDKTSGDKARTKAEVASTIRQAANQAQRSNSVGEFEMGMIRKFIELSEPEVDWHEQIADYFEKVRDQRMTYSIYSRRSNDSVIFPSKDGEYIRAFFGVDSSGSMGQNDLNMAASELQGFLDQIPQWTVDVATADTKAYFIETLESEMEDDLFSVDVEFRGGGGTRMSSMVELAQEDHDEEYQVMIIITDGYLMPGDIIDVYESEIPLLVIITEHGVVPPWLEEEVTVIQMRGEK